MEQSQSQTLSHPCDNHEGRDTLMPGSKILLMVLAGMLVLVIAVKPMIKMKTLYQVDCHQAEEERDDDPGCGDGVGDVDDDDCGCCDVASRAG